LKLFSAPSLNPTPNQRLTRECLIFLAFFGLTILMTWPWALHLRDAVSDPGDPYLNAWIMWWDYHQTFHDPLNLFQANIFYPYRYTLAFSEHNYGLALPFFPLFALGLQPLTIHGLAILLGFAFSGYGAFRLARTLDGSTAAAWITGIAFAFVPYRFAHLSHLNYLFAGWIPIVLEALVLYARERSWRRAWWLGAAFLMNGLTCIHWLVLTVIPLLVSAIVLVSRERLWRSAVFWRRGAIVMCAASIILLPFLIPYLRVSALYGFERKADEVLAFSALPGDWLVSSSSNKLWGEISAQYRKGERELFPGLLPVLLAVAAFFIVKAQARQATSTLNEPALRDDESLPSSNSFLSRLVLICLDAFIISCAALAFWAASYGAFKLQLFGVRILRASSPERALELCVAALLVRLWLVFLKARREKRHPRLLAYLSAVRCSDAYMLGLVWICLGFFGSLGLNFFFHRALYDYIPLFHGIRVPARWAMICDLGLALLAGLGARRLVSIFTPARPEARRTGTAAYVIIALALLFEQRSAPMTLFRGAVDPDALTLRLKATEMRGGIVELPAEVAFANYAYVLRAADHARPLVTGVSGFVPPIEAEIETLTREHPVPERFLDLLETIPASYLIVHNGNLVPDNRAALESVLARATATGRLRFIRSYNADPLRDDLYAVTKIEPQAKSEASLPAFVSSTSGNPSLAAESKQKAAADSANPIDDAEFFVRQHYRDFLEREPEDGGLNYWATQIMRCGTNAGCIEERRVTVSEAFLVEPEFQETALFVYRLYKGTLNRPPAYEEFVRDRRAVVGGVGLNARKASFVEAWIKRKEFARAYPSGATPAEFVDALLKTAEQASGVNQSAQRESLIAQLAGGATRAAIVRRVVEGKEFAAAEFNAGFVAAAYFAYLRREPNADEDSHWNEMLNSKMLNNYRNIVRELIDSEQYRSRFTQR